MRYLLLAFTALIISACAMVPTYPPSGYSGTTKDISVPALNSVNTASLGDDLLRQGIIFTKDSLNFETPVKVHLYTVQPGEYLKTGISDKGEYFNIHNTEGGTVYKTKIADAPAALFINSRRKLCVITVFGIPICADNAPINIKPANIASDKTFQQILIYNGKVGNKINIGYREFSGSLARPAFSNNVEYDLNESNTIGYKGALLEVLNATNQSITYRVIRNFNTGRSTDTSTQNTGGELQPVN